jgi:hypothetical protein
MKNETNKQNKQNETKNENKTHLRAEELGPKWRVKVRTNKKWNKANNTNKTKKICTLESKSWKNQDINGESKVRTNEKWNKIKWNKQNKKQKQRKTYLESRVKKRTDLKKKNKRG